jgi:hypothetical protein
MHRGVGPGFGGTSGGQVPPASRRRGPLARNDSGGDRHRTRRGGIWASDRQTARVAGLSDAGEPFPPATLAGLPNRPTARPMYAPAGRPIAGRSGRRPYCASAASHRRAAHCPVKPVSRPATGAASNPHTTNPINELYVFAPAGPLAVSGATGGLGTSPAAPRESRCHPRRASFLRGGRDIRERFIPST